MAKKCNYCREVKETDPYDLCMQINNEDKCGINGINARIAAYNNAYNKGASEIQQVHND